MEKQLKYAAVILTLIIVLSFFPAIFLNLFTRISFWIFYIICLAADLWSINRLKKLQNANRK